MSTVSEPKVTRTLMRGLTVLECFADTDHATGLSLTEVATRTGIDRATALRFLTTYCVAGYLRRDVDSNLYSLTAKLLRFSNGVTWYQALKEVARPELKALRDESAEVVHLGVVEASRVIYIDKLESDHSVKLVSAVGQEMPMNTTALGKAILAERMASDSTQLEELADTFEARTSRSLVAVGDLRAELERTLELGFAVDDNENEAGVLCLGAPVFDRHGEAVAAISVSGPDFRTREKAEWVGPRCRLAADRISAELQHY